MSLGLGFWCFADCTIWVVFCLFVFDCWLVKRFVGRPSLVFSLVDCFISV